MTRIIAVTNQKGGVGKTTTTINLGASLARMHRRVLLVDLDPQANATVGCGVDRVNLKGSSYQLLLDACTLRDAVVVVRDGLDLLPAESGLAGAQAELGGEQGNDNYRLRSALGRRNGVRLHLYRLPPCAERVDDECPRCGALGADSGAMRVLCTGRSDGAAGNRGPGTAER